MTKRNQKQRNRRRSSTLDAEHVSVPAAGAAITRRTRIPRIMSQGVRTIVCNTEAVNTADVTNTLAYATFGIPMGAFRYPWLAGIAQNYSKWRWLKLRYVYVPQCPTTTNGQVILSLSYDHTDANPANAAAQQQMYHAITSPFWAGWQGSMLLNNPNTPASSVPGSVTVDVDVARLGNSASLSYFRFISLADFGALSTSDQNLYSGGNLFVGTEGGVAVPVKVGSLFVEYEIELIEPVNPVMNA